MDHTDDTDLTDGTDHAHGTDHTDHARGTGTGVEGSLPLAL